MTLAEIPAASTLFIDANVFVYHFVGASARCSALLARCETGVIRGMTSILMVAETAHRLMMIEAVERRLVTPGNVARKLAQRPDVSDISGVMAC
jgi:predicted nucleic acid-binding protein